MRVVVEPCRREHRGARIRREHHAQAEARRTAAIAHALLQVECDELVDRTSARQHAVQIFGDPWMLATFAGRDEQHRSVGLRQQLAVEEICRHGVLQRHRRRRHGDHAKRDVSVARRALERVERRSRIGERELVVEQHVAVADGDHVVVEHARVDCLGTLLREHHAAQVESMEARHRHRCGTRLPGRIA